MLRILAVHRYVWPDSPPYAALLPLIGAQWARDGHDVEVWGTQPSYQQSEMPRQPASQHLEGVRLRRLRVWREAGPVTRVLNQLWFPALVAARVLFGPGRDVVMCSTMPPVVLGALLSRAARVRGARFVYHCMDLHPELGRISGDFRNPVLLRLLARLERGTCRRATLIVVLSEDMRRSVLARDSGLGPKIRVVPNFELPADKTEPEPLPTDPERPLRVVFTGNLGRFQDLERVVALWLDPAADLDDTELVLMGSGALRSTLERLVAEAPASVRRRVTLLERGSVAEAKTLMRTADLGLVSLAPDVVRYASPSKAATYLEAGLPLVVAAEPDCGLVQMARQEGLGVHLDLGDPASAVRCLRALVAGDPDLALMSRAARAHWERHLAAARVLPAWSELVLGVVGTPSVEAARA